MKATKLYWNLVLKKATVTKRQTVVGPLKTEPGHLVVKDDNKACLRNTYFASVGEKLAHELLPSIMPLVLLICCCSRVVCRHFPMSSWQKTVFYDLSSKWKLLVPMASLQKLLNSTSHKVSPHLASLYRWSISHQTVYGSWKLARVSPIFEKDDRTNPGYYQLVSLLSVPSKLLESEINTAIANNATSNNLITPSQWAYRKMDMDMKSVLKIVITCFTFNVFVPTFHPHK